jgi:hypothetical protein
MSSASPPAPEPGAASRREAIQPAAPRLIRTIFQALAVSFAVVGLIFLLFPDGTVRCINAVGTWLRIFPPAPVSALRFWLSLGVSYMALVTVLAALIQRDPVRYRHLMPVLAAGKFCSSFTCLLFFVSSSPTFLYLLNFLVDGSITVLVLACYAWAAVAAEPATEPRLLARSEHILQALIDTLLPAGGAFALAGSQTPLAGDLWAYAAQQHRRGKLGLALLLQAVDYGPYLLGPRRRRFSALSADDRCRYLTEFESSRFALRRQVIASLKLIIMLHFYDYPAAQRAVGYDGVYLRDKLLAGPNAVHHRARLQ